MSSTDESHQAFHRGTAPIFALLTAEQTAQLAELRADPALANRLAELAAKANEGTLSANEHAEYEAYIEANNLLTTLQTEARFRLSSSQP
jgi:hypothetical protein